MEGFNLFQWLAQKLGMDAHTSEWLASIASSLFVLVFLTLISLSVYRRVKKKGEELVVPSARFNLQNIIEVMVEWLVGLVRGILGDRADKFLPLLGTLFIYILTCNLLGFIPGFMAPTTVITTNLACALIVFIYYNYIGMREAGPVKYMKHFLGPVIWLGPLIFCIEIISHIVRPVSLSVRLYGNMTGDHMVVGIFSDLVPILVPVIFMALGLFVCVVQAFVFTILSTVYIALAAEH